jgi:hypothetical protein
MNQSTTEVLNSLLRGEYNALDEAKVILISPVDLASRVYSNIDSKDVAPALVRLAAILELRQLARAVCRQRITLKEAEAEQNSLFDFKLQPRYPVKRDLEEEGYVLREYLTYDERRYNIERLRKEANAKLTHADALEAETEQLISLGKLQVTV